MKTYRILDANMERLTAKLNRIRNKCIKYGCDFAFNIVGEEFETVEVDGVDKTYKYILVECEGTAQVNGWEFIAEIDYTQGGNVIKNTTDLAIPSRYFNADCECEHCHRTRTRTNTYLIHNTETGDWKQVGRNCLCDFTGGLSAEAAAEYIALFDELIEGEQPYSGSRPAAYVNLDTVLAISHEVVERYGYRNSDSEHPTKAMVREIYDYRNNDIYLSNKYAREFLDSVNLEAEDLKAYIEACREYFKNNTESSDYMHNLKTIAASDYFDLKFLGYVVSMIPTYNRAIEKAEKAAQRAKEGEASNYVGAVGERTKLTFNTHGEIVTSFDTAYGTTFVNKITDQNGNIFIWMSSTAFDTDRIITSITATIKEHSEYRGTKQTQLTRCKVEYAQPKYKTIRCKETGEWFVDVQHVNDVLNIPTEKVELSIKEGITVNGWTFEFVDPDAPKPWNNEADKALEDAIAYSKS